MKQTHFFSLKWKLVIYSVVVLLFVNSTVIFLTYRGIDQAFDTYLNELSSHQHETLQKLIDERAADLQYLTSTLGLMQGDVALQDKLKSFFDVNGSLLQLDWSMTSIQLYDKNLQLLYSWPTGSKLDSVENIVRETLATEAPADSIYCADECVQYAGVPVFLKDSQAGVLLVSATLSDTVLAFGKDSPNEIVILSSENKTDPQFWGRGISLSTNLITTRRILTAAEKQRSIVAIQTGATKLFLDDKSYLINEFDLQQPNSQQYANLFLIRDISLKQQQALENKQNILWFVAISLIISAVVLWRLLWQPVQRIRLLTKTLPFLAKHQFSTVRKMIARPPSMFSDEFDLLNKSVEDLSSELERLQGNVASHTLELIKERDFTNSLLDTAPAIILTQNGDGGISLINRQGVEIAGENCLGKTFVSILNQCSDMTQSSLASLYSGHISHFEHTGSVIDVAQVEHSFSWFHRSIHDNDEVKILTVGVDTSERDRAEQQLAWLADHDPLTGLYNRRRFQVDLEHALQSAIRYKRQGALLYFDLDQFKLVNDTSGHQAGDILLRSVAQQLSDKKRSTDIVGRMGGDEFAWLCPEMTEKQAVQLAQLVSNSLAEIVTPLRGYAHRLSASIGIAMFPDHGHTVLDLLSNADLAMYEAKEKHRGGWHLFSGSKEIKAQMDKQIAWKSLIESALKDHRLQLYFQPILDIRSNKVTHHEALLRLIDVQGNLHYPGEFIPVAEHIGLIQAIDLYVLDRAIDVLTKCARKKKYPRIAVNLSGKAMENKQLPTLIAELLDDSGVDPDQLIFEITETAAVSDVLGANQLIKSIRSLGCKFALDDFGVGFSSFYYLKELPADYVKIDGAFIRNLVNSKENTLFVKAIIEVSAGLGKKIIAEYVQDEATLMLLKTLGADYAQGYYIGKPVNMLELEKEGLSINLSSSA